MPWIPTTQEVVQQSPLSVASVSLTNADILAFGTPTAKTIVAAPGAGMFLNFIHGLISVDATAGGYTNIHASATVSIGYPIATNGVASNPAGKATLDATFGNGDAEETIISYTPTLVLEAVIEAVYLDKSQVENQPLVVSPYNGGAGIWTGGNNANSGVAKVWYTTEVI